MGTLSISRPVVVSVLGGLCGACGTAVSSLSTIGLPNAMKPAVEISCVEILNSYQTRTPITLNLRIPIEPPWTLRASREDPVSLPSRGFRIEADLDGCTRDSELPGRYTFKIAPRWDRPNEAGGFVSLIASGPLNPNRGFLTAHFVFPETVGGRPDSIDLRFACEVRNKDILDALPCE